MSLRSTTVDYEAPKELKQRAVKRAGALTTDAAAARRFWAGKSGRLYRFTVYSLIECPPPGAGVYVLVKRNGSAAGALHVGIATSTAPTLNLAHIRNMEAVTLMGGIIFPPVPAFYSGGKTIDDLVNHTVGRVLDLFDVEHDSIKRWAGVTGPSVSGKKKIK